ncbi:acetoacetate--CoA ligase [Prauserella cavernicola]|uniref:Acetoacetate--CoA ligase n=1 Tax=Prauserella cavernicola TaxID=2800127 RepID=A0A934QYW2_9PSEU|nr:acetoacetate--CoA ligase [Prauserella cavernicola]MBK1787829.1 acetoacetate--CoA ligase [Prauserella cavernicola]
MARHRVISEPDADTAAASALGRFATRLGFGLGEYDALWRWSVSAPADFWRAAAEFTDLPVDLGPVDDNGAADMAGRRFFPEGRVNVAAALLSGGPGDTAVFEAGAEGVRGRTTYAELKAETEAVAAWLRATGVGPGSVVATIAPNGKPALVSFLATLAVGATWTSCSPDFSADAVLDRIGQVSPAVLFAPTRYRYNGRDHDYRDRVADLASALGSLRGVVLLADESTGPGLDLGVPTVDYATLAAGELPRSTGFTWDTHPFDTPALVMYSSGTTGKPKAIVHSGGGILLKLTMEHAFHTDLHRQDVTLWFTNIAWMMFHWLALTLVRGGAIVLYDDAAIPRVDGRPDHGVLWRLAQECGVTAFGTSPSYLAALQSAGYRPGEHHDLSAIRTFLSSGAPLSADQFEWVHAQVPAARLSPISGGTELLSSFLGGSPLHPVRAGEMSCRILGQAVDVLDEKGSSVVGVPGELVCTRPFPSMPLTFVGEGGDERYRQAYFEAYDGIWTHGDLAEMTLSGGVIIHGRSDNTLNPQGVRIGTAEVYRPLESVPEISDSVVFGLKHGGDERIVLCVVLQDGLVLDDELATKIRATIRGQASPRHVPAEIHQVSAIPYTLNGKRVEGAARKAASGEDLSRFTSLANPECLREFAGLGGTRLDDGKVPA